MLLRFNKPIFLRMSGEIGRCPIDMWHTSLVEVGRKEVRKLGNQNNLCVKLLA